MMINNINVRRVQTRLKELFKEKIDLTDMPLKTANVFETRALAAFSLVMMSGMEVSRASGHITDGYHDMGIDAIYLDEIQKKLFLVQSKWRSNGTGAIKQEEMQSFAQGIQRILEEDLNGANKKIAAKSMDIDTALTQMGYQICAIFIHTGDQKANDYAMRPILRLQEQTNDEYSTLLLFKELNFKDIFEFLANGQEQSEIKLDDVILSNWGKRDFPFVSYYGSVSAAAVGEWYKMHGNLLFAKNIRFYKGNTEVNENMRKVLLQEPERFFYYNNGIKLLCKSIKRKAKDSTTNATGLFVLEGASLVNGAQTTETIGTTFMENPEQVAKANVMIQIIDLSNVDDGTAKQITKLSNTQNRIESKDFAALDPEQERLRTELAFSNYSYLYKSGDNIINSDKQVSFDEAIVALACLKDISYAVIAKNNVGALSEDITKAPYKALVNAATNSYLLLNSVLYMREVEQYLQNKRERVLGNRERLVCIHANRYILHFILKEKVKDETFNSSIIEKKVIKNDVHSSAERLIKQTTELIDKLYPESYPANIFKNTTKCRVLEEKMQYMN